jgi:hypothetical protein
MSGKGAGAQRAWPESIYSGPQPDSGSRIHLRYHAYQKGEERMIQCLKGVRRLCLIVALGVLLLPGTARAQITVDPTITFLGGLFHYEYAVTNNEPEDLVLVTLEGIPLDPGAILNLTAPTGFLASFDSGLGLVDFISDTDVFAFLTTVSGFSFDSPFSPQTIPFSALGINGSPFAGTTRGPAGTTPVVPEPGSLPLLSALGLTGTLFIRRRARKP